MKASELIAYLEAEIEKHGDLSVKYDPIIDDGTHFNVDAMVQRPIVDPVYLLIV